MDIVDQIISITGNNDRSYAKSLVEACGGNLSAALDIHFNSNGPPAMSSSNSTTLRNVTSNSQKQTMSKREIELDEEGYRMPIPTKRQRLIEAPSSNVYRNASPAIVNGLRNTRNETNSIGLGTIFKPPYDIMYSGSFEEAKRMAKEKKRWLIVDVQDTTEFDCHRLNRDIWANTLIKNLIINSSLFVQLPKSSPEGQNFINLYRVRTFPHVAVIDPRTSEQVFVLSLPITAEGFISKITLFMGSNDLNNYKSIIVDPSVENKGTIRQDTQEEKMIAAAIAASLDDDADNNSGYESYASSVIDLAAFDDESNEDSSDGEDISMMGSEMKERLNPKKYNNMMSTTTAATSHSKSSNTTTNNNNINYKNNHTFQSEQIPAYPQPNTNFKQTSTNNGEKGGIEIDPIYLREPEVGDGNSTKIRFLLADGKKVIRRVHMSLPVGALYKIVKVMCPSPSPDKKIFELITLMPKRLLSQSDMTTIRESGLINSSINMRWVLI